ncbi:MAG: zinc ribbon domain-containing protein [Nitrososphaerota archaeon]|uniref:zinc ribbon domain-containing protein n=1 Tax=Candidatus Bathycorpusculum sp. TaxID=2994959 RepID=UPI002836280F|nr:zinc ribbon domain-containing protein [Candidatus Termiticorpusculum sp.]MCL2257127.1 zinc ribbon domain-containing protein [Candidatus Termiticorpusculum sp.]MCL2292728.1 zinc ribbon domain-containing protein [Candidatus Termiticorpusculum sp.]MDR0459903.1 zinc ribbon domain-containing protein [Nitrososphaerota archaeon]
MSYCRNCGVKLADDAQFCYSCGTPKTLTTTDTLYCRNCNTQIANDAKYCYKCGTPTTGPITITPQPLTPISPPSTTLIQESTSEKTYNNSSHKETLLLITISILIITIIALAIAIIAFSPLMDIFNNQPFDHPGINIVKSNLHQYVY